MRDKDEILQVFEDYNKIPYDEFFMKYGVETTREAVAFVKALLWVLDVEGKEVGVDI